MIRWTLRSVVVCSLFALLIVISGHTARAQSEASAEAPTNAPAAVSVPDLTGMNLMEAEAALGELGLKIGLVSKKQSGQPVGTVVRQGPTPGGKTPVGSEVAVAISKGFEMSTFGWHTEYQTMAMLNKFGFTKARTIRVPSCFAEGVIEQVFPNPDTPIDNTMAVTLLVASGTQPQDTCVGACCRDFCTQQWTCTDLP